MNTTASPNTSLECHWQSLENCNQTISNETAHDDESSNIRTLSIATAAVLSSIIISGGNLGTLVSVGRCHKLQTIPNLYICSLAVADLLVGQVLFLKGILEFPHAGISLERSKYFCLLVMSLLFTCVAASMFSSTLVALDRYIFIRYPLRYDTLVTRERSVAWIVIAWCLAVAYGCVPLYWNNFMSSEGCTPTHIFGYEYMIVFHPFMFLSLSVLIFTLYFKISKTALQHNRRINAQNVVLQDRSSSIANGSISEAKHSKFSSDTSENTCLNNNKQKCSIQKNQVQFKVKQEHQQIATPTTRRSSHPWNQSETGTTQGAQSEDLKTTQPQRQEQQQEGQQQHRKTLEQYEPNNKNHLQSGPPFTRSLSRSTLKMIKMLIFVFGLFFLSWCPLLVVGYLEYTVHVSHLALSLAGLTGVLNSGINCLVLVVMNKDFRREYQSLFCWCFIRK